MSEVEILNEYVDSIRDEYEEYSLKKLQVRRLILLGIYSNILAGLKDFSELDKLEISNKLSMIPEICLELQSKEYKIFFELSDENIKEYITGILFELDLALIKIIEDIDFDVSDEKYISTIKFKLKVHEDYFNEIQKDVEIYKVSAPELTLEITPTRKSELLSKIELTSDWIHKNQDIFSKNPLLNIQTTLSNIYYKILNI